MAYFPSLDMPAPAPPDPILLPLGLDELSPPGRFLALLGGLPQVPEAAWFRSEVLSLKQRPQAGQRKGFSSWIFSCLVRDSRRLKDFWQMLQAKGRLPEWVTLCWSRWPLFLKPLPHSPQQKVRSGLGELRPDFRTLLSDVMPWLRRWRRRLDR